MQSSFQNKKETGPQMSFKDPIDIQYAQKQLQGNTKLFYGMLERFEQGRIDKNMEQLTE